MLETDIEQLMLTSFSNGISLGILIAMAIYIINK